VTGDATPPAREVGYYGRPVLKPPVWTWEVPVYLFVGGIAGMSAVIAFAARVAGGEDGIVRTSLWIAVGGALASALLLVSDLGRPTRLLHMLRVLKWRSPMSVGVWVLSAFGGLVTAALALVLAGPGEGGWRGALLWLALGGGAVTGALLSTYTGVLLAATAVPAWNAHRGTLPVHFGVVALGSAAALLELLGHPAGALHALGLAAASVETAIGAWIEVHRHGDRDRALRTGRAALLLRGSGALAGPVSLVLRVGGLRAWAAAAFLLGALVSRFGWLEAGRASTRDPRAALGEG